MLTIEEAYRQVIEQARSLPTTTLALEEAAGLVLAENITADGDSPPFTKALVDGFAVRSADGDEPRRVIDEILAGQWPSRPVGPGEAIRIMTGAPLPEGADTIVMVEKSHSRDDGRIGFDETPLPGRNWMEQGQEYRSGDILLNAGSRLGAASIGVCASAGRQEIAAVSRPTIAILSTGDELVTPGFALAPGQIRDSNGPMLRTLARLAGANVRPTQPAARDDETTLRAALRWALNPGPDAPRGADLLVVSGGVSAGDRDLVPAALEAIGIRPVFHKVQMKPGKPLWFGVGHDRGDRPPSMVFGLPGNPVGGLVGMLAFVLPVLRILAGEPASADGPACIPGRLHHDFHHRGDRPTFHPSSTIRSTDPTVSVEPITWAGSADLRAVTRADGFLWFPSGDRTWKAGEVLPFLPMPGAVRL